MKRHWIAVRVVSTRSESILGQEDGYALSGRAACDFRFCAADFPYRAAEDFGILHYVKVI